MATTVKVLAKELKRTAPDLLEQLKAAGIEKGSEDDSITEKDKTVLLEHLQKEHGSADTGSRKKITLIKRENSEIRQADSAGRTRTVQVEVRKKRVLVKAGDKAPEEAPAPAAKKAVSAESAKPILSAEELEKRAAEATRQAELLARQEAEMKAAEDARQKEADAAAVASAAEPATEKSAKADGDAAAAKAAEKKAKADKAAKDIADANKVQLADITKRRAAAEAEALAIRDMMSAPARVLKAPSEIAAEEAKKGTLHKPAKAEGADDKKKAVAKVGGKTIKSAETSSTWQEEGAKKPGGLKTRGDSSGGVGGWRSGGGRKKQRQIAEANVDTNFQVPTEPVVRDVHVPETITVAELAHAMAVKSAEVIKLLMGMGQMVTINQVLDQDTAMIIVEEMGHKAFAAKLDDPDLDLGTDGHDAELLPRPPVVTVMGHVDHGKTSLLDKIRAAKVATGEAGGITQHIGAYHVETPRGMITFLDTPGHEAFTAMRARGAKVTDIAIIVVAADDAVMPQTKEAISHAQAANVPMIFAVNKIDKDGANPQKIYEQLSQMNILVEDWGGKYQCQEISSKSGQGIDDLLEKVLLEAEMLELTANPNKKAVGSVIEAELDKGRGYVTTLLVQAGTLNVGDMMLAGDNYGRVKAMFDHHGNKIKKAGPSTPVQVLGLNGAPQAGDKLLCLENEREAREIANKREQILREQTLRTRKHITLEEIGRRKAIGTFRELNVIVKGDVDGSVEALSDSLMKLSTEEVQVRIIHKGVGQVSESDVALASTSDAVIIAFQVRPSANARRLADTEQIEIRNYSIIYQAIDEIKAAMEGMLAPTFEEVITANIEVRDVFKISKIGTVAGSYVLDGTAKRSNKIRVIRDFVVIHDGEISALKRFKDDVAEVKFGYECGLSVKNFNDLEVGDLLECYEMKEVKRTLK